MNILPINNNENKQNFTHAIRVSYCVRQPNAGSYEYVNPRTNKELYKKLNSKIVGWLNESMINKVREALGKPAKDSKTVSNNEALLKDTFLKEFEATDSDYKKFGYARSIYNRNKLGFLATGYDVPIIENLKGATDVGLAKSESILLYGTTHTDFVRDICRDFDKNSKKYIAHPLNRLMKDGKEVLLRLNFRIAGKDKKGKEVYEFDNYLFDKIKKPLPEAKHSEEVQVIDLKKTPEMEGILRDTIGHLVKQVARTKEIGNLAELVDNVLKPKKPKSKLTKKAGNQEVPQFTRKARRKKIKDDPRQLKIPFVFEN